MVTKEQALEFSKSLLLDQPEADEKFEFLKSHTEDGYFWPVLRCFLVGIECKTVVAYIEKEKPNRKELIGEWMLEVLQARLQDKDKLHAALKELQEQVTEAQGLRDDYEETLREMQKVKLECKNMKQSMFAKDQMIKQLQEKINSNVPTVGTTKIKEPAMKSDLSLEAFKKEVLLNKEFTPQQRDYLFSLLERGEPYSQLRIISVPGLSVDDMKRLYQLINKKKGGRETVVEIAKKIFFSMKKEEED